MEGALRKAVLRGSVKDENEAEATGDDESSEERVLHVGTGKDGHGEKSSKAPSPTQEKMGSGNQDGQLELTKAKMDEVMEENQRLKLHLDKVLKDYRALQMQYQDVIQQESKKTPNAIAVHQDREDDHELISLSLGRSSSDSKKEEAYKMSSKRKQNKDDEEGLALGLDCKYEVAKMRQHESSPDPSPENSMEEVTKEEAGETWPPHKITKNVRNVDDDISQQNPSKRARVSVRVRCDTPTMNDGCQWRKYGQKIAKGNPCPRAYYRCTVAQSCPVQRCAEDMSILITTYEGTHNHPLPVSATAMASTTSAAASMLLSGSSTSGSGLGASSTAGISSATLNGLNFYLSDNSRPKSFYLPNSSISASSSYPTITLDLTSSSSSTSAHHLTSRLGNFPPRYSTTNLNFNSPESNALPISWSTGVLSYGTQPYNKDQAGSLSFGPQPQETLYPSYLQNNVQNPNHQSLPPDSIAAATKAITSDPSFQSALASALKSIIGSAGANPGTPVYNNIIEKSSQNIKSAEPFPILSSFPASGSASKCTPSFLNKSSSSGSSQPGGLMFLQQSPFPFSKSKSKSNSPGDNRDHII